MIEYVEIRDASRQMVGIVDTAKSVIWHTVYNGTGDFEVYAPATLENINLLAVGNYVTRYDDRNVGIIEKIEITYDPKSGRMIAASGRFAKELLGRRIIYTMSGTSVSATILRGNVEAAARSLVSSNAISCTFDSARNIAELTLGASAGTTETIVDSSGNAAEKQVTYDNLLDYTDSLLEEYGLGAYCGLADDLTLAYTVFKGADRSTENTEGNEPVIFSQDFDNLLSSAYEYDRSTYKNAALIGGQGEGLERFCVVLSDSASTGAARREIFVDARNSSKTYKDDSGKDQTLTDAEYSQQLISEGRQKIAESAIVERFDGEIDLQNGSYEYGTDYALGDIVTVQDLEIGLYINVRLLEITEVQDDNGYQLSAKYGRK